MLDTHTCFISFIALPNRPLQSTLEPRSRSTLTAPFTTSSSPLTRSRLEVPRQEALPFRSVLSAAICASHLMADHVYFVSVRRYLCFRWLICIRVRVAPLSCNILVYPFVSSVVLWYYHRDTLISIMYPACMITVHDWNRGRYKLVSEPTACRKPPNHSLVEVESSICKNYFANLLFGLRAHIDVTTCDISGIRILFLLTYDSGILPSYPCW